MNTMITPQIAIFLVLAAVTVAGAVSLILQRHPIHSALSLIVVMVALAGLYLLQGAEFVAAVQIIVYAGAIMVLFIFVIMLLNAGEEERSNVSRLARFVGVPLGIVFLVEVAYWIGRATAHLGTAPPEMVSTRDLSSLLFREYVFPFELTSFLILIALLGALVLARREESN
jgi:NADH-quinone oxidoreductase subunit J